MLPLHYVAGAKEVFDYLEGSGSGCVSVDALHSGLRRIGAAALSRQEVADIVRGLDSKRGVLMVSHRAPAW